MSSGPTRCRFIANFSRLQDVSIWIYTLLLPFCPTPNVCWRQCLECGNCNTKTCAGAWYTITVDATLSNYLNYGHHQVSESLTRIIKLFPAYFKVWNLQAMTAVKLLDNQTCFDFLFSCQHASAIPKGRWMPAVVNWGASVTAKPTSWDAAVTPALQAAMALASTAAMVSALQPAPLPVPLA